MSDTKRNHATDKDLSDMSKTSTEHEKPKVNQKSSFKNDLHHESNAEVFLNLYAFKPSTVPPFALVVDTENKNETTTQRRFNQKRHEKQKEKNMKSLGTRSLSSSPLNEGENAELESVNTAVSNDQMSHWNNFMSKLNYVYSSDISVPSYEHIN